MRRARLAPALAAIAGTLGVLVIAVFAWQAGLSDVLWPNPPEGQGLQSAYQQVLVESVRARRDIMAAVVVGASVILFDPIFQGLALSLMAGEVASTVLSRMAVPVLYYLSKRRKALPPSHLHAPENVAECETPQCEVV